MAIEAGRWTPPRIASARTSGGRRFLDGVVDVDVAFELKSGFHGLVWRVKRVGVYESFILPARTSPAPGRDAGWVVQSCLHGEDGIEIAT